MLVAFIRALCLALVRLFYKRVRVAGMERVPKTGPVIVVANHPNGLIDPVIVGLALEQRVHFLAKSTLFGNWLSLQTMRAFLAVPVYRAKEADTTQNEKTFAACREIMTKRGFLALFPEGTSHSETHLQPLKTGAARIALSSEAASDFKLGVTVLPVGLTYDAKESFRSAVTASIGEPFSLGAYQAAHAADPVAAAKTLTADIADRLRTVVLEADDQFFWRGFRFVARWVAKHTPEQESDHDIEATARKLSLAYAERLKTDPEQVQALVQEARKLDRMLDTVGISDPFALDLKINARHLAQIAVLAVLLAPIALLGAAFAYLPYRLTDPLARKLARGETDLVGTIKALLGLVLIGGTYIVEALAAGLFVHWMVGVGVAIVAPATGYVSLRYFEWLGRRRALIGSFFLRMSHAHLLAKIETERASLAQRVAKVLAQ